MKAKGFTLVELLVVIVIIAVLAVVAYPLYTNYVKNARLSEAHQAMMDNAQAVGAVGDPAGGGRRAGRGSAFTLVCGQCGH